MERDRIAMRQYSVTSIARAWLQLALDIWLLTYLREYFAMLASALHP